MKPYNDIPMDNDTLGETVLALGKLHNDIHQLSNELATRSGVSWDTFNRPIDLVDNGTRNLIVDGIAMLKEASRRMENRVEHMKLYQLRWFTAEAEWKINGQAS